MMDDVCLTDDERASVSERFWAKVSLGLPDDCWEWCASTNRRGYGRFMLAGKSRGAHRVAYFLSHGDLSKKFVLHRCDNPPCCNPAHLFLGTAQDNMDDMMKKGRHRPVALGGEDHPSAKLDWQTVEFIRSCDIPTTELARQYGVSYHTIYAVRSGANW